MAAPRRVALRLFFSLSLAGTLGAQESLTPNLAALAEGFTSERPTPPVLLEVMQSWIEPTEPAKIVGPIHYVGTKGLAAYLVTTPRGHILLDGGMPESAKDFEASIRKLGFKPEDIRLLLITHAHIDHAGTTAYFKKLSNAEAVVMDRDFELLASGGKTDFRYGDAPAFFFPAVTADRQVKDGETVSLGNVKMTARLGAGHTKGATTWTTKVEDGGKSYDVVFPCCLSINPGYRLVVEPSYPGIADDYARTVAMLESLKPDVWLPSHAEFFGFEGRRARAAREGVSAWVDPDGYGPWIAKQKANLEQVVAKEKLLGNPESAPEGLAGTSWRLVRFQGMDDTTLTPDDPSKYTLEFLADGKLAARIDCNRGTGAWTSEGPNQLELGPLGLTRMACPPARMSDRILKDWSYVRSYVLKDGRLFVSLMADGGIYEFEPLGRQASATTRAAPPLEGTYWKLIRLGDVAVAAPSSQRAAHLTLDARARRVTGSGGCNRVTGSYEVNGDRLSFSRMAKTMMACADGMENETDFLKALEQAKTWRIDGDALELFDADGKSLARFEAGSAPS